MSPNAERPRASPRSRGGGDRGPWAWRGDETPRVRVATVVHACLTVCAVSVDAVRGARLSNAPEDELSVIRRAAAIEGDARSPRPPSEEGVQHELLTNLRCQAEGG